MSAATAAATAATMSNSSSFNIYSRLSPSQSPAPPSPSLAPQHSKYLQMQLSKAAISRQLSPPHSRARAAAQTARGDMSFGYIQVLDGSNTTSGLQNGLHRKDETTENGENPYVVDDVEMNEKDQWTGLDLGGVGVRNLSPALCKYSFLTHLFVNHNKLTQLPAEIGDLRQLVVLDASGNQIETLPTALGRLTNLKQLLLFDNQISVLPSELGGLYQLEFIGLEGNRLGEPFRGLLLNDGTRALIEYLRDNGPVPSSPPERKWVTVLEGVEESSTISVFCYNILSETYASKVLYGYTPSWALAWDYRKELILQEIMAYHSDVICLQEVLVEIYEDYLSPALSEHGYAGVFYPKTRTRTMNEQQKRRTDGCAIFFKTEKFAMIEHQMIDLQHLALKRDDFRATEDVFNRVMNRDNIATTALLKVKSTGAKVIVVCAHVHWDPAFSDVKIIQVGMMMEELTTLSNKWAKLDENGKSEGDAKIQTYSNGLNVPLIICGDFNSTRSSGVGIYLGKGRIDGDHEDFLSHTYGRFTKDGMSHNFSLASAYETARTTDKHVLDFTNLTPSFTEIIDYIWYSQNTMDVVSVLGKVDDEYLKNVVGFPNAHFPSDHLPISATLRFKQSKRPGGYADFSSMNK